MDSSPIRLPALGCVYLHGSVISLLLYRFQKINLQPLTCASAEPQGLQGYAVLLSLLHKAARSAGGQELGMGSSCSSCQQDLTRFGTAELSTLVLGSPCRSCIGSKLSCTSYCQSKPLDLGTGSAALESHESPVMQNPQYSVSYYLSHRPCPSNLFIRT